MGMPSSSTWGLAQRLAWRAKSENSSPPIAPCGGEKRSEKTQYYMAAPPFLLALALVHPFALVAERPRQRLIAAVDVLRLFETWHLRYLSTIQRGPCSHLSARA